jgi:hypothetical protein
MACLLKNRHHTPRQKVETDKYTNLHDKENSQRCGYKDDQPVLHSYLLAYLAYLAFLALASLAFLALASLF